MGKLKTFFTACALITGVIITTSFFQHEKMKHSEPPKSASSLKNPFKGNISATQKGKALFQKDCVVCHGTKGKGDGITSGDLQPRPADLTSKMTQSHTDGELYWIIMQGSSPMPSFKEAHKANHNQCWQLINYIRELGKSDMSKMKM